MAQATLEMVYGELKKIEKNMVTREELDSLMNLMVKIQNSEAQIKQGKFTKAKTSMSNKEIDDLLTA